jgi:hypothetical protein
MIIEWSYMQLHHEARARWKYVAQYRKRAKRGSKKDSVRRKEAKERGGKGWPNSRRRGG